VSCPSDGSLVALCKAIIKEFDRLLGTAFMRSCGARPSLDDLLAVVAMCSLNYNLGLLVIDEIQNLSVKKGGGRESMLNFFQNLANDFKLPVLLIGTMKALHLLEGSFRTARRATAVGSMQWSMMPLDATWNALVKIFWQFQWIRKPVPLTEELVSKLHSMTCGVVSLLVALLFAAQLNAIRNKSETVTLASLEKTLREDFKPLKPLLDALRSGDMRRIAQYDDMMSSGFWDRLKHEAMAPVPSVDVPRDSAAQTQDEWRKAVVALVTMGYPESDVEAALAGAKKAGASTAPKLVPLALKSLQGVDAEDERGDPNDLRLTKS
ncbi:MAG: ATP-binding protein, partial [Planctomycetales bacterium]|nr:ATP-binding protein [Planctomycetales bacterium]